MNLVHNPRKSVKLVENIFLVTLVFNFSNVTLINFIFIISFTYKENSKDMYSTYKYERAVMNPYTMLAALKSIKKGKPKKLIVAVPTGNSSAINLVKPEVDEIYCLNVRDRFIFAVADAYDEWHDVGGEEVFKVA